MKRTLDVSLPLENGMAHFCDEILGYFCTIKKFMGSEVPLAQVRV
jgi:hypothetical protein